MKGVNEKNLKKVTYAHTIQILTLTRNGGPPSNSSRVNLVLSYHMCVSA
jgi:hypothetical protein